MERKKYMEIINHILETGDTNRKTAKLFGVDKSTIYYCINHVLKNEDYDLYLNIQKILERNKNNPKKPYRPIKQKYIDVANYIIDNNVCVLDGLRKFNLNKSTFYGTCLKKLRQEDFLLYSRLMEVIEKRKAKNRPPPYDEMLNKMNNEEPLDEKWVFVKGYNKRYIISSYGRVARLTKIEKKIKILSIDTWHNKCTVNLGRKRYSLPHIVALHFIPNPNFKPCVMHKDGNKLNNAVSNLKWAYVSEVMHNAFNVGMIKGKKPTYKKIGYNRKHYNSYYGIAKDLGISKGTFYSRYYKLRWGLYEALEVPVRKKEM